MDLATITHKITLSTTDFNLVGDIKVRQADDETQVFDAVILEHGMIKNFEGLKPFFCLMAREVTGQGVSEEPVDEFDAIKGRLKYTLSANSMQMVGRNEAYFSFRRESSSGRWVEQFSTKSFHYTVERSIYTQPFKDSNYWFTFNELYRKFVEYQEEGKASWEDFVNQNRDIIESVDPGGKILTELIDARGNYTTVNNRMFESENKLEELQNYTETQNFSNSLNRLVMVDAYGSLDQIHPKVLKFKQPWNGYYWWCAFTPYTNGDASVENPHILASNNMKTWVEPTGFKNPLEPQPSNDATKQYNSDTHLVFREDMDQLECWWRFVDVANDRIVVYRKTTRDGINWTNKEIMVDWKKSEKDCVCPVVMYEDDKYKCWFVNDGYKMWYMESEDGKAWSLPKEVLIPYESSTMKNWHHDIIHTSKGYEMVIVSFENTSNRNEMNLYYSKSENGLTEWSSAKTILTPSKSRLAWDNRGLYRSSILYDEGIYYVFYSGINKNGSRGIGISYGSDPTKLKGYQNLEAYIFNNMKAFNMVNGAYLRNYGLKLVAPQIDQDWTAFLNFNNINDVKLAKKEVTTTSEDLLNFIIKALKVYEAIYFQGTSAWVKANEIKFNDGGKAARIVLSGDGEVTVQNPTGSSGSLKAGTITLEDTGVPSNPTSGMIRWAESRKKLMYYDGNTWKNVGE